MSEERALDEFKRNLIQALEDEGIKQSLRECVGGAGFREQLLEPLDLPEIQEILARIQRGNPGRAILSDPGFLCRVLLYLHGKEGGAIIAFPDAGEDGLSGEKRFASRAPKGGIVCHDEKGRGWYIRMGLEGSESSDPTDPGSGNPISPSIPLPSGSPPAGTTGTPRTGRCLPRRRSRARKGGRSP
jgi:hypothetical protein